MGDDGPHGHTSPGQEDAVRFTGGPAAGATSHPGRRTYRLRSRGRATAAAEGEAPAARGPRSESTPTDRRRRPHHPVARLGRSGRTPGASVPPIARAPGRVFTRPPPRSPAPLAG